MFRFFFLSLSFDQKLEVFFLFRNYFGFKAFKTLTQIIPDLSLSSCVLFYWVGNGLLNPVYSSTSDDSYEHAPMSNCGAPPQNV